MGRGGVGTGRGSRVSGPAPISPGGERFAGFPASAEATVIPSVFFSRLLPEIESPEELAVSLYAFYVHGRKRGWPRAFSERELAADSGLMTALAHLSELPPAEALAGGLARAADRGTLLRVPSAEGGGRYALNLPANRKTLPGIEGERPADDPLPAGAVAAAPNIFALYEENIGGLTPLIVEDLIEAEEQYPPRWIEEAFREAVSLNKRSWRYVHSILKRWQAEGPSYEEAGRDTQVDWRERYVRGKRRLRARP